MMLDLNTDNTVALDAVAWPKVTEIAVDRIVCETWSEYIADGEPAEGATLLDSGHLFTTMVVYQDGTWHVVAWSDRANDMLALAAHIADERSIPLEQCPSMASYLRSLN